MNKSIKIVSQLKQRSSFMVARHGSRKWFHDLKEQNSFVLCFQPHLETS